MTTFDWLGKNAALLEKLTDVCEQLAVAAPEQCGPDPAWQRLINDLEAQERSRHDR